MTKSLTDVISDLLHHSKPATRLKALEAIKGKSIEWPESLDEYSRLINAVMESVKTPTVFQDKTANGRSLLVTSLGVVDLLIENLTKAISHSVPVATQESMPPLSLCQRVVDVLTKLLMQENALSDHEGAVEYICRIVKSMTTGLFQVNNPVLTFSPVVATNLLAGLLSLPAKKPRHQDLIRASVWATIHNFPNDFSTQQVEGFLKVLCQLFQKSGNVTEMTFNTALFAWFLENAFLQVRESAESSPRFFVELFQHVSQVLVFGAASPQHVQLQTTAISAIRICLLIVASDVSGLLADIPAESVSTIELFCKEKMSESNDSRIVDLLVDVRTLMKGFESAYTESTNADLVAARIVEKWVTGEWSSPHWVEPLIYDCIRESRYSTLTAIIHRLSGGAADGTRSENLANSVIQIRSQLRHEYGSDIKYSAVISAMLAKAIPKIPILKENMNFWINNLPRVNTFSTAAQREALASNMVEHEIFGFQSAMLVLQFLLFGSKNKLPSEDVVFKAAQFISPEILFSFMLAFFGEKLRAPASQRHLTGDCLKDGKGCQTCVDAHIDLMREALSLRGPNISRNGENIPAISTRTIGKSVSFLGKLIKRLIDSDKDLGPLHDALCNLSAAYIVLGSLDVAAKCDSCLLTSALALASRGPRSKSLADLRSAIDEATVTLAVPIRFCQCAAHTDALGEPRSLLSQAPITVNTFIDEFESQSFSASRSDSLRPPLNGKGLSGCANICVSNSGKILSLKNRLQQLDLLSPNSVLDLVEEMLELPCSDIDGMATLVYISSKPKIRAKIKLALRLGICILKLPAGTRISDDLLSGFLKEVMFEKNSTGLLPLVLARSAIPLLFAAYDQEAIIGDIFTDCSSQSISDCAVRLASGIASTARRVELLGPIILKSPYTVYVLDEMRRALPEATVRRTVGACWFLSDTTDSSLQEFLCEELKAGNLLKAVTIFKTPNVPRQRDLSAAAVSLVTELTPHKPEIFSMNPIEVLDTALELWEVLRIIKKIDGTRHPLEKIQMVIKLSERPWLLLNILRKFPGQSNHILRVMGDIPRSSVAQMALEILENFSMDNSRLRAIVESSARADAPPTKRLKMDRSTDSKLPIENSEINHIFKGLLQFPFEQNSRNSVSLESTVLASLHATVWWSLTSSDTDYAVPLMYALNESVQPQHSGLAVNLASHLSSGSCRPDPLKPPVSVPFSPVSTYPVSETCALAVDLVTLFPILSSPAIISGVSCSESLAEIFLPFLFLLGSSAVGAGEIATRTISPSTCGAMVQGIVVASRLEFLMTNCTIPSGQSAIFDFLKSLDLTLLAKTCLDMNRPVDAYFLADLTDRISGTWSTVNPELDSNSLGRLFEYPTGALPIQLSTLVSMNIRLNSLSLSLHSSVRPQLARLRGDEIGLLYDDISENSAEAANRLGIFFSKSAVADAASAIHSLSASAITKFRQGTAYDANCLDLLEFATTKPRGQFLEYLIGELRQIKSGNLIRSHDFLRVIFEMLKDAQFYPPAVDDQWNDACAILCGILRKIRPHQSRIFIDWCIKNSVKSTTAPAVRLQVFYALAKTLWALSQYQEAVTLISALSFSDEAGRIQDPKVAAIVPRILSRAGEWIGELRVESLDDIRARYFNRAVQISVKAQDLKSEIKSKIRFVKITDQVVAEAVTSSSLNVKSLVAEEFSNLCEILTSGILPSKSAPWFASRVVSLWFSQSSTTSPIIAKFRNQLSASTSLLPFFYQIAGRISGRADDPEEFRKELVLFIIECASKHTCTCLPPILQLRQGIVAGSSAKNASAQTARLDAERSKRAELIVDKIRSSSPKCKQEVDGMVAAFKFYINLAMTKVVPMPVTAGSSSRPGSSAQTRRLVSDIQGYAEYEKIINCGHCPVLTSSDGTMIKSIVKEFTIADSGKSLPKIVKIIDSNGKSHRQIVKGNDDLRNDSVLQQLFSLLDAVSSSRLRSYKVVPITACAGIAEWVSGTVTIGSYLVGYPNEATGAHVRYRPQDISPSDMKGKMIQVRQQSKGDVNALIATYKQLMQQFSPCMNYFFFENFPTPKSWFAAQSAYASSVAATSIVGFIVGLGDRHPNNILLDVNTGEVVHIDYGICFDAGRFLKVPEIVPFRLTRDMIDGLGTLGTQGPFSKLCEDVLVSLKTNSALVTAVVEVFVVDPLFNWAVASLGSDNAQAALQGVKRKLQGLLDNTDVLPLTPSAQVDRLIRSSTDPRNLAVMFAGWQPWL